MPYAKYICTIIIQYENHSGVCDQPMNAPTMHVCELNKINLHPGMRLALYIIMKTNTNIKGENTMTSKKEIEKNAETVSNCKNCTLGKDTDCTTCPNWNIRLSSYMNNNN